MSHTWTYIISNLSWVTGEEQPHNFFKVDWFWGYIYRYTPVATPLDSTGIVYRQKLHRQTQLKRVQTAGLYKACVNCYEHILRMLASNLWLNFFFTFVSVALTSGKFILPRTVVLFYDFMKENDTACWKQSIGWCGPVTAAVAQSPRDTALSVLPTRAAPACSDRIHSLPAKHTHTAYINNCNENH